MRNPLLLVALFFLLFTYADTAAAASIKNLSVPYFEKVGNKDDIPWQIVMSITQDHDGFLWLGTQKGLLKYDGYAFTKLSKVEANSALTDEYIKFLATTSDNKVVIATRKSGLAIYLKKTNEFITYPEQSVDHDGLVSTSINALATDNKGGVYVGTAGGLDYVSLNGAIKHLNNLTITELFYKNNTLWFASKKNGLFVQQASGEVAPVAGDANKPLTENSYITAMFNDSHDNLWLTLRNGSIKVVSALGEVTLIENTANPRFNNIIQVNSNEIWLSSLSSNSGILAIDISKKQIIKDVFDNENSSIKDLYLDRSGLLWIGTNGSGLYKYNTQNTGMYFFDKNLFSKKESNQIKAINNIMELDNGDVLIGTRGHGIYHYHGDSQNIKTYQPFLEHQAIQSGIVTSMAQGHDGAVWFGISNQGLYKYSPNTQQLINYGKKEGISSNWLHNILVDENNAKVWIAATNGLLYLDLNTNKIHTIKALSGAKTITLLLDDKTKSLWVGSYKGLYNIEPSSNKVVRVGGQAMDDGGLVSEVITGVLLGSDNKIWVDTAKGLHYSSPLGKSQPTTFTHLNKKLGLANEQVFGNMLLDNAGNIWGDEGVLNTQLPITPQSLFVLDEASGFNIGANWLGAFDTTKTGKFLFAGSFGVLMINPEEFIPWHFDAPLAITKVMIDNVAQPIEPKLVIAAENKGFSVEFSSLDFSNPRKNIYRYKLTNYDNKWIDASSANRLINYTNLNPGDYSLEIIGTNRVGDWGSDKIVLPITVLPKFYQTWWFFGLIAIALLLLSFFIYRWRMKYLIQARKELESLVKQRTEKLTLLAEEMRLLSITDELSQISNRRHIFNILNEQFSLAQRHNLSFAVISFDIDHFKNVNDTWGHHVGDEVIKAIAAKSQWLLRTEDSVGRVGGEEFLIVLPLTAESEALTIANRLLSTIEAIDFSQFKLTQPVTISAGIACFNNRYNTSSDMLADADTALYQAKNQGRNRCVVFDAD
ncbi:MAG: diguanylate cyclase [Cognaticolwellia sp.]